MQKLYARLQAFQAANAANGSPGDGGAIPGELSALLDQAMGEASGLREAVASAASEAGRWRAEANRLEKEHGNSALEVGGGASSTLA